MNNESKNPESDISLPFEDRIDILFQEIELAVRWDRPSIIFAIYKSDQVRDEVNEKLAKKLSGISQKTHSIKTNHTDQFNFLSQISELADLSQTVLLINGFNWECGAEGVRVFQEFNEHREYFIDNNIRAIFWLFENEVSEFAANATECWILRHRVVEFVDVPQSVEGIPQAQDSVFNNRVDFPTKEGISKSAHENIMNLKGCDEEKASHAHALLGLGMLFWRKGKHQRALKFLRMSVELSSLLDDHSLLAKCQNALAQVYADMGKIEEAISAYKLAISLSPESEFLWNNLGQLFAKNERNEEAINAYKQAISCSEQDFMGWDGLGHIYVKFGVYQNAISAFEKALEIAPYFENSWAGIGKAYLDSDQLEKAESSLRKAVELNDRLVEAWIDLARCVGQLKRDSEAIEVFQHAIDINPLDPRLYNELGKTYLQQENQPQAIAAFQKAISIDSRFGEAFISLAFALYQIGDYAASALNYENCIPLFEDGATRSAIWNRLGDNYLLLKDYEKAIEAYRQSDQNQKDQPDTGETNDQMVEEINNSQPTCDQALEQEAPGLERGETMIEANHLLDVKTAAEWNEHGNAHLKEGAYNDAIVAYTKAIELAPDACWPYIQNLAHVHYEKGKARGRMNPGMVEDPDLWEGDEGFESNPLFSDVSSPTAEQKENSNEPVLVQSGRILPTGQPPAATDPGKVEEKPSAPGECCAKRRLESIPETGNKTLDGLAEDGYSKIEQIQTAEIGLDTQVYDPVTHQPVSQSPQNSIDWNELGNSYACTKKYDSAIEAYKKAIEMNPKFGQPYSNLGYVYHCLGKYEVAILLYKKSLDLLDNLEDKVISWNRLGDAYRRVGDYGNASDAYQQSSNMAPTMNPLMARARATLLENVVSG